MKIDRGSLRSVWIYVFMGACIAGAHAETPAEAAHAMVEAEKKFYQTGQEQNTRAAFLAFLADDGIVFSPGPVNGKEAWGKRPESAFDLIWEPTLAVMARSADFGYNTGPAKWRANKKETEFGHGHFISIWKKQKDGSWKVALDLGIENPEPAGKPEMLRTVVPADKANARFAPEKRRSGLKEAQDRFIAAAKLDFASAFLAGASDDVRTYRNGTLPAVGKEASAKLVGPKGSKVSMETMGGEVSSSADLAYNYGKYSTAGADATDAGHFFQIWQTDPAGSWKIVIDWQQSLPKEKK